MSSAATNSAASGSSAMEATGWKVAFIGLGHMGGPMAANLVSAGYSVTGFDVVPEALAAAEDCGVLVADSAATAATGADVIITMLPAGKHVFAAFEGEGPGEGCWQPPSRGRSSWNVPRFPLRTRARPIRW